MLRRLPVVAVLLCLLCLVCVGLRGDVHAAPDDVTVGDVRAVLSKQGAVVRSRPAALSAAVATLPHGTRLRVTQVQGRWIRVTPQGADAKPGWLKAGDTVEPFALTQAGRRGPIRMTDTRTRGGDVSAAGRQFDPGTEETYRREHPNLEAFYPLVDQVESRVADPAAVDRFIREGGLGRPEGSR